MKIVGIALVALVVAVGGFFGCAFMTSNQLIEKDEAVNREWATVQAQYQRRLDLIPNLVRTVEGATRYEGPTLIKITEARNQLLGLANRMDQALKDQNADQLDKAERDFLPAIRAYTGLAAEAYPALRATDQFTSLQAELAGTENRIAVARRDFNERVASYNATVRKWGWLPFCGAFEVRKSFEAASGAEQAPKVEFK